MITCFLKYQIDPYKINEFEAYAQAWIPIVHRLGGIHLGYFLPHEGANNIAYALFNFSSLTAYEEYRHKMDLDPECQEVYQLEAKNRSIVSYERSFLRPLEAIKNL